MMLHGRGPLPASCQCGLQNHRKASTHNAFKFKFGTALQKLALTYSSLLNMHNMQENMQENMQNMTTNMQNMTTNMQNMTKICATICKI
jgi:hypothetical protein